LEETYFLNLHSGRFRTSNLYSSEGWIEEEMYASGSKRAKREDFSSNYEDMQEIVEIRDYETNLYF
jgi:hypothetical protein